MATLATLRKEAKGLGIPAAKIRQAKDDRDALQGLIENFNKPNGSNTATKKRGAVKKAVAAVKKNAAKKKGAAKKTKPTAAKKSGRSKSAPAQNRKSGSAKRSATATKDSGRYTLDGVDFSVTDGWNAREGSGPDRIVKALRKFRGNRTKAFEFLLPHVSDFVGKKMRNGTKRSKSEMSDMLKYRVHRTAFDFAIATGQHESSTNRVEYGTGGTGQGVWKPAKKGKTTATPKRASGKRSTAKRGSTAAKSTPKRSTAKRGSQKRATAKRMTAKRTTAKRSAKRRTAKR